MSAPVQPVVHTPGPWRPGRADKSYDAGIPDNAFAIFAKPEHQQDCGLQGNAAVICVIARPERMTEEDIANAKLIAAAPDLLEAIQGALRIESLWMPPDSENNPEYDAEFAALATMRNKFREVVAMVV